MTDDPKDSGPDDKCPKLTLVPTDTKVPGDDPTIDIGANDEGIAIEILHLEHDHTDLNAAIEAMELHPHKNRLSIARLKKKKLLLKDQIVKLKDSLTPHIIA